ncbi:hypothetical protein AAFF_G00240490 [Aldrovandia affinis]|uniref:Uncharacterized protein n=1 Tax=Aldrovandia affinis TaxID=143900 RepID=A0AAD7SUQ9_9TELE|nr:hypothetical protein AAFF_G00240490 [Aldrovandia affinis]
MVTGNEMLALCGSFPGPDGRRVLPQGQIGRSICLARLLHVALKGQTLPSRQRRRLPCPSSGSAAAPSLDGTASVSPSPFMPTLLSALQDKLLVPPRARDSCCPLLIPPPLLHFNLGCTLDGLRCAFGRRDLQCCQTDCRCDPAGTRAPYSPHIKTLDK